MNEQDTPVELTHEQQLRQYESSRRAEFSKAWDASADNPEELSAEAASRIPARDLGRISVDPEKAVHTSSATQQ